MLNGRGVEQQTGAERHVRHLAYGASVRITLDLLQQTQRDTASSGPFTHNQVGRVVVYSSNILRVVSVEWKEKVVIQLSVDALPDGVVGSALG